MTILNTSNNVKLSISEEAELLTNLHALGRPAYQKLFNSCVPMLLKISFQLSKKFGMDRDDLAQSGAFGIMKAIEKFDPSKGARLVTYAAIWVKATIMQEINNMKSLVRLPQSVKHKKAISNYCDTGDTAKLDYYQMAAINSNRPENIDDMISEDSSANLPQTLTVSDNHIFSVYDSNQNNQLLLNMLSHLPDKWSEVIKLRYGLEDNVELTLYEVAYKLGLSVERIRVLEGKALRELRKLGQEI